MNAFDYTRPASLDAALAVLRSGTDVKLLAGGQSLLASMKMGLMQPECLLDLQGIAALRGITVQADDRLHIGAMSTHAQIAASSEVQAFAPGLCDLAGHIADAQIRNRGTVGGSLANNDPAACWPAGVLALSAVLHTDRRSITADDFFIDLFTTALEPDEVLVSIHFERPLSLRYVKFEQPASRFALVGVAVARFESGVRVAVTGTSQGVVRLTEFEAALNQSFTSDAIVNVRVNEDIMGNDIHAQADYRAHLAFVGVRRAVAACLSCNRP